MMKTTRHSLMAKGIMILLSLLVLAFGFSYSWFTVANPDASAEGLSVVVEGSADFDYSIGFATSQTGYSYVHTEFENTEEAQLDLTSLTPAAGCQTMYLVNDEGQYVDADGNVVSEENRVVVPYNLLYDYNPIDVTGNGATLIRPSMNYGNWSINANSPNYSLAEPNVQYLSFDLIVRALSPCTVSLDKRSFAKGALESYAGDYDHLVGNNNKSTYGNISKDAIVGSVRVAFVNFEDDPQLTIADLIGKDQTNLRTSADLLWIPRPDIYLDNGSTGANDGKDLTTDGWTLRTGLSRSDTFDLFSEALTQSGYSTYQHQYYNIFEVASGESARVVTVDSDQANGYVRASSISGGKVAFNQTAPILRLTHLDDTNGNGVHDPDEYYYGKVRVRIWLEGTDTEARRALAGGNFSVNFDLSTN